MSHKVGRALFYPNFLIDEAPLRSRAATLEECQKTCGSGFSCEQSADAGYECLAQSGSSLLFVSTALSIVFGLILIQLVLLVVLRVCVCKMRRHSKKDRAAAAQPQQADAQVEAALLFRQASKLIVPDSFEVERSEKTEARERKTEAQGE